MTFMWRAPGNEFDLAQAERFVTRDLDQARARLREAPGQILAALLPFDLAEPTRAWVGRPSQPSRYRAVETDEADAIRRLGTSTTDAAYRRSVRAAVAAMRGDSVQKVVLCRHLDLERDTAWNPRDVVERLRGSRASVAFGADIGGGLSVVGASPEVLVSVDHGVLRSMPLAGSAPRSSDVRSRELARERLRASAKDHVEHDLVVQVLRTQLTTLAGAVDVGQRILETSDSLHLMSELTAVAPSGTDSLGIALRLHPTPAVCGTPTDTAVELIRRLEDRPRGYLTGVVGWQTADGNGEWRLVIRAGVLAGNVATISAGAGIVAASDDREELDETRHKMLPMLRALGALGMDEPDEEMSER